MRVGPHLLDDRGGGRGVLEVGLDEARRPGRAHAAGRRAASTTPKTSTLRLLAPQELDQVAPDEAAGAGDEQLHR